jgi:hypothetical protein
MATSKNGVYNTPYVNANGAGIHSQKTVKSKGHECATCVDAVSRTFKAKKPSLEHSICSSLVERVSQPQAITPAEPTLEEKTELCELLKKAKRDPLDPQPLDIRGLALEFEKGGYRDLSKLQKAITCICLGGNHLKTLPRCIRLLTELRELDLICNELETLPEELIELPYLVTMHLQKNKFQKVPPVILKMAEKRGFSSLDLHHNSELREIPVSLTKRVRILSLPDEYIAIEG